MALSGKVLDKKRRGGLVWFRGAHQGYALGLFLAVLRSCCDILTTIHIFPINKIGKDRSWNSSVSSLWMGWLPYGTGVIKQGWLSEVPTVVGWRPGWAGLALEMRFVLGGIPPTRPFHSCLCVVHLTLWKKRCVLWQDFHCRLAKGQLYQRSLGKGSEVYLMHYVCLNYKKKKKPVHMKCISVYHVTRGEVTVLVLRFLNQLQCTGEMMTAFHIALKNPPIHTKNPAVKVRTTSSHLFTREVQSMFKKQAWSLPQYFCTDCVNFFETFLKARRCSCLVYRWATAGVGQNMSGLLTSWVWTTPFETCVSLISNASSFLLALIANIWWGFSLILISDSADSCFLCVWLALSRGVIINAFSQCLWTKRAQLMGYWVSSC